MAAIQKIAVIVGMMYFFWLVESILTISKLSHGHTHGPVDEEIGKNVYYQIRNKI